MLAVIAFIILMTGIITGYLIGSRKASKVKAGAAAEETGSNAATVNRPNVIVSNNITPQVVNVYFPDRERVFGKIPINSYNKDNFYAEDGRMAYHDDEGKIISHFGIDLSYHQPEIDWDALEASGIEFVMLRCGYRGYSEGGLLKDEKFDEYAKECNDRNIPLGVYFFSQSLNEEEAVEEAEFTLSLIKDYKISYPVVLDTEYVSDKQARTNTAEIDDELRTRMCIAFCRRIEQEGYYPMIYASENWIRRELNYEALQDYDFWAPQYLEENDFLFDFTMWQYTCEGRIDGIEDYVDLNISMVDYASFVPALREAYLSKGIISKGTVSSGEAVEEW